MGVGFSYTPATYTAISWFPDKRGLASGLCMACNGGSASFLAPICANLVNVIGVEMAMILIGIILGGIILICSVSGFQSKPLKDYVPAGYVLPASTVTETQLERLPAARAMKSPCILADRALPCGHADFVRRCLSPFHTLYDQCRHRYLLRHYGRHGLCYR